jgi:hypothetical protein
MHEQTISAACCNNDTPPVLVHAPVVGFEEGLDRVARELERSAREGLAGQITDGGVQVKAR